MIHTKLSAPSSISTVLTLLGAILFFGSPVDLFAQELNISPGNQSVEAGAMLFSDTRLQLSGLLRPKPEVDLQRIQGEDQNLDSPRAAVITENKRTSGNVIAVLKVTVTDNDVTDTANEGRAALPDELSIQGNYPNPFRTTTRILFHLPETAKIHAEVFDILGRVIYTSQIDQMDPGWDRTLLLDLPRASSGLYIYRISVATASERLVKSGRIIQVR